MESKANIGPSDYISQKVIIIGDQASLKLFFNYVNEKTNPASPGFFTVGSQIAYFDEDFKLVNKNEAPLYRGYPQVVHSRTLVITRPLQNTANTAGGVIYLTPENSRIDTEWKNTLAANNIQILNEINMRNTNDNFFQP